MADAAARASDSGPPLSSIHTSNLGPLLEHLRVPLLVSSYQAGKLVVARSDGAGINTHFRGFDKPTGMACDGQPRFVTAMGTTDSPGGWRANKRSGGLLLEVPSGEVIARGLSMPHSPRWHDGRLARPPIHRL